MKTTPARTLLKDLTARTFLSLEKGKLVIKNAIGETFPLQELCELTPAQVQDGEELLDPLHDVRKRAKDLIAGGVSKEALAELFAELQTGANQTAITLGPGPVQGVLIVNNEIGVKDGEIGDPFTETPGIEGSGLDPDKQAYKFPGGGEDGSMQEGFADFAEGELENAGERSDDTVILQGETAGNPVHSNGVEGQTADSVTEKSGSNGETPHVGESVNGDDRPRLPRRSSRVSGG